MMHKDWLEKPYYTLDAYCKNRFGYKCYKVALNAHMTCPNRDGTVDHRGCIFCSAGGSGDFALDINVTNSDEQIIETAIDKQLQKGVEALAQKFTLSQEPCIIAYFQAYTNTYAPLPYLKEIYTQALSHPKVCGISIATRPDCLPELVLDLLSQLQSAFPEKFIWIELGLQTIHEDTARYIRRGYPLSTFEEACRNLKQRNIPFIVHIILGLPGEDASRLLQTIQYLNELEPFGVKLQLLHILKDTDLAIAFEKGEVHALTKEAYLDMLIMCLAHLNPGIVIHRVTGDGPKKLLLSPLWSGNKRDVLNTLHKKMRESGIHQGSLWSNSPDTNR